MSRVPDEITWMADTEYGDGDAYLYRSGDLSDWEAVWNSDTGLVYVVGHKSGADMVELGRTKQRDQASRMLLEFAQNPAAYISDRPPQEDSTSSIDRLIEDAQSGELSANIFASYLSLFEQSTNTAVAAQAKEIWQEIRDLPVNYRKRRLAIPPEVMLSGLLRIRQSISGAKMSKITSVIELLRAMPEFHNRMHQRPGEISEVSAALAVALEGADWEVLRGVLTGADPLDLNALLTLPPVQWTYPGKTDTIPKFPPSLKVMVQLPRFLGDSFSVVHWENYDTDQAMRLAWALTELPKRIPGLGSIEQQLLIFLAVGMVPLYAESWWALGVQRSRFNVTESAKAARSWLQAATRISWQPASVGSKNWSGTDQVSNTEVAKVTRDEGSWTATWRVMGEYSREETLGGFTTYQGAQEWVTAIYEGRDPNAETLNGPEEALLPADVKRVGDNLYETPDGRYVIRKYPEPDGWIARSQHLFETRDPLDLPETYQVARGLSISQARKNLARYLLDWERGKLGARGRYGWDGDARPVAVVPKQPYYFARYGDVEDIATTPPAQMTPKEVNDELDYLDAQIPRVNDRLILLGRGHETFRDLERGTDPLAVLHTRLLHRLSKLRHEIHTRTMPAGTLGHHARVPDRMPANAKAREAKGVEHVTTSFYEVGTSVNMEEMENARQRALAGKKKIEESEVTTYFTEGWPTGSSIGKDKYYELIWQIGNVYAHGQLLQDVHVSHDGRPWRHYRVYLFSDPKNRVLSTTNGQDWLNGARYGHGGVATRAGMGPEVRLTELLPSREYMIPVKPTELWGPAAEQYAGYLVEQGYKQVDAGLSAKEWKLLLQYPSYEEFDAARAEWHPKTTREDPYTLLNVYDKTFEDGTRPVGVFQLTKGKYNQRSIKFVVSR